MWNGMFCDSQVGNGFLETPWFRETLDARAGASVSILVVSYINYK
jgi:hypothetical protein